MIFKTPRTPEMPDETVPTGNELGSAETDLIPMKEFLDNHLNREVVSDNAGFSRSVFTINGRRVMFRNRDEFPAIGDGDLLLADDEMVKPTGLASGRNYTEEFATYIQNNSGDSSDAMIVTTNTPEGILMAASILAEDSKGAASLKQQANEIHSGSYSARSTALLDAILGATQLDDDGAVNHMNTDGYAIVLAALAGDRMGQDLVKQRISMLHDVNQANREKLSQENKKVQSGELERLSIRDIVLVHSTEHPIERDAAGDVVLFPAAAKREDQFPRATVHFTANGQVTSHAMGSWDDTNRLIVCNFNEMTYTNGLPDNMSAADTYFSVGPGENITLPGALIVEPHTKDTLIDQDAQGVTYSSQEQYSDEDTRKINALASRFNLTINPDQPMSSVVREIALRIAEQRAGAKEFMTIGEHGAGFSFDEQYWNLARGLGVTPGGHHTDMPEGRLESAVVGTIGYSAGQANDFSGYSEYPTGGDYHSLPLDANLRALRTVAAAGYLPTRPSKFDPLIEKRLNSLGVI